jgi:threonylcarbamoyladenosine tRNA methylthiotransferase MtaB
MLRNKIVKQALQQGFASHSRWLLQYLVLISTRYYSVIHPKKNLLSIESMTKTGHFKIAVGTLGCKVNHYDSAAIAESLSKEGYQLVAFPGRADAYIINTCTVTQKTDAQSRQLIRRALKANPLAPVIVTGCYAQKAPEHIASLSERLFILGNPEKTAIVSYLTKAMRRDEGFQEVSDVSLQKKLTPLCTARFLQQTRAYLKIQDGCNADCSYCVVPQVRGPSRSLPLDGVKKGVYQFAQSGYLEIVLTGIHLGAYGWDLSPASNLTHLLENLACDERLSQVRFRLSSIEPTEISDDLISLLSQNSRICPHLHIPLQSGDEAILKKMNRPYSPAFFKDLVGKLLSSVKDLQIGVDVIVGFPGESERQFHETLQFIQNLPVGYLHVFPFSIRPGTQAASFSNHVPTNVKKERAKILREIGLNKKMRFYSSYLGRWLTLLVEGKRDSKTLLLKGFSENYIPLFLNGPDALMGKLITVKVKAMQDTVVYTQREE